MPIPFSCTVCGQTVQALDHLSGQTMRCPYCREITPVPEQIVEAVEVSAPQLVETSIPVKSAAEAMRRACPTCGEMIMATARKCRFCGELLDEALKEEAERSEGKRDGVVMNPADYVCAVLCPVLGCFIGVCWLLEGKRAGPRMVRLSLLFGVFWVSVGTLMKWL